MSNAAPKTEALLNVLRAELDRACEAGDDAQADDVFFILGAPCNPGVNLDELVAASMRVALRMQAASAAKAAA